MISNSNNNDWYIPLNHFGLNCFKISIAASKASVCQIQQISSTELQYGTNGVADNSPVPLVGRGGTTVYSQLIGCLHEGLGCTWKQHGFCSEEYWYTVSLQIATTVLIVLFLSCYQLLLLLLQPFNGLLSMITWVSWYQKSKTNLDLNEEVVKLNDFVTD